jgi:phosphopantothenoylcysteine decarboxylase / phosphopantothenate---cysteine ligase
MKTVLLGVTGGIAAVKIPELVGKLKGRGVNPIVIMTQSASSIISSITIQKISGNKVYTELFEKSFDPDKVLSTRIVDHIALAKKASLFVIVPATANCIAKLANGIADDYITTTALAVRCPVVLYPSMNTTMWMHPATRRNVTRLKSLGYIVVEPGSGKLACGDEGKGRLPPLPVIENQMMELLTKTEDLKNKTVIVTSGGTMEKIDDIRFITNKSSGKMGAAIADECFIHGAKVILLRANNSISTQYPCTEVLFESADDLEKLLKKYLTAADICIHAAAISDYTVKHPFTGKTSSDSPLPLELTPRTKILDTIKSINPNIFLVAFKAEWRVTRKQLVTLALNRLKKSGADMIVANDVSTADMGIASDYNEVEIINLAGRARHISRAPKKVIAGKIVEVLVKELDSLSE